MRKIKTALISLSDKSNLLNILKVLKKYKIKIVSSGGTLKEIKKYGFNCVGVSEYTGSDEMLDGRVKTLHPQIHAGILFDRNKKSHEIQMRKRNFDAIDLIVVNLYPFQETIRKTNNSKKIIENIDIGGPTMVRSAAKNHKDVTVITDTKDYNEFIKEINKYRGKTSLIFRERMASKAFSLTAYYDSVISEWFNKKLDFKFPEKKVFYGNKIEQLRYGENPHQKSSLYKKDISSEDYNLKLINGKQLSYNNYNDILAALIISKSLPNNTGTVIVKHANPCGVSILKDNLDSYKSALACDPISAFGGIVSCNFKINQKLALELNKIFLEVVVANDFDKEAIKILKTKKNLRLINANNFSFEELHKFNSIGNSFLIQSEDKKILSKNNFKIVSKIKPNKTQFENLIFAFNICRFVKSNAIVIASNKTTIGIGSGQPSRLDSCQIAINKMEKFKHYKKEIVAASDAFFPFVDGIEKLVQSGVSAVIQPAGSIRDKEIIKFANDTNTVLIFSKTRHFRH